MKPTWTKVYGPGYPVDPQREQARMMVAIPFNCEISQNMRMLLDLVERLCGVAHDPDVIAFAE